MIELKQKTFYSENTQDYLRKFSKKYSIDYILNCITKLKDLKVLVVGEAIIDEYQFGSILGKAAKEPIIALKYRGKELYAGGSLAVANHLSTFCKEVGLFAMLGDQDAHQNFIEKNLQKNIKPTFFYKKDSPTITKRRFLEDGTFRKLLEFYDINDSELSKTQIKEAISKLAPIIPKYDLVICTDFGHGFLNRELRNLLIKKSRFLSVNTQVNAGNFGYHTISLYPKADYICLDEREIRLECRSRLGDLNEISKDIFKRIDCNNMITTHGPNGCIGYENTKNKIKIFQSPSLAIKTKDSVGAGDAFFAISSPLVYNKVPMDIVCLIGNSVGALALDILGNKKSVTKEDLVLFIKNFLELK